ncbi:uncharacterized protein si:dkey-1h24.6 [Danio aesculapii]|uniref:uncharacterized protein si:dkey-1h24.6 n=1 Tax=Danio aesculapii TaxID=1142201 RepID=UPI0024BF516D|nr:uncharacterized protein si:dkey-1h24.6 [Danio aesculapii]
MEIFWTCVTFFSLCLFQSTLSETQSMCKGELPPIEYVALNSTVKVVCPKLSAPEMDFRLFKDCDEVISIYVKINYTSILKTKKNTNREFPAEFSVDLDNSTSFILAGVTVNMTALYTCEASISYPPPFKNVEHKPQTIVFVEARSEKRPDLCQQSNHLNLWVAFGFLALYGVLMTCITILRIKPRQIGYAFKDRECGRKWQGVQHPTRQGFYIQPRNCLTSSTVTKPL